MAGDARRSLKITEKRRNPMIPVQFDYVAPTSIEEAVGLLERTQGARALAGGQSLLTDMKHRPLSAPVLVDLHKVGGLKGISYRSSDGALHIGAMTTCDEIASFPNPSPCHLALADAVEAIGDRQIRNRATIGGNLACNHPAADLPAVALALAATIHTASPGGSRSLSAEDLLAGAFQTSLRPAEIIVSVDFPAQPDPSGSAYEKFKNEASGYAICGVAAMIRSGADGAVARCRVALTGASGHTLRLRKVEAALEGKEATPENIVAAAPAIRAQGLSFLSDMHASAEYRAHLAEVLTERALTRAMQRQR
jgi:carbon-monoxide dehydrogenase medium subunit